jgi:hypothetical protein
VGQRSTDRQCRFSGQADYQPPPDRSPACGFGPTSSIVGVALYCCGVVAGDQRVANDAVRSQHPGRRGDVRHLLTVYPAAPRRRRTGAKRRAEPPARSGGLGRALARALPRGYPAAACAAALGALARASCPLIVLAEIFVARRPDGGTVEMWTLTAPARWASRVGVQDKKRMARLQRPLGGWRGRCKSNAAPVRSESAVLISRRSDLLQ